jgi:hypothetical protein
MAPATIPTTTIHGKAPEIHRLRRILVRPSGGREAFDLSKDIARKLD